MASSRSSAVMAVEKYLFTFSYIGVRLFSSLRCFLVAVLIIHLLFSPYRRGRLQMVGQIERLLAAEALCGRSSNAAFNG